MDFPSYRGIDSFFRSQKETILFIIIIIGGEVMASRVFPGDSSSKESAAMQETLVGSWVRNIPLEEGHSNPLQCSHLENPWTKGVWRAAVHRIRDPGHNLVTDTLVW